MSLSNVPRYLHRGGRLLNMARIGQEEWIKLANQHKRVINQNILIKDIENVSRGLAFPKAELVVLDNTSKDFAFDWLSLGFFPELREVWLNGPIHADVLYRFHPQYLRDLAHQNPLLFGRWRFDPPKVVLGATFATAKERWGKDMHNLHVFLAVEGCDLMKMYLEHGTKEEDIKTE